MLGFIKNAIAKIGTGFLYGIGIGVSVGGITYLISERMTESIWNDAALDKVVVTKHEEVKRDEAVYILGTAENRSSDRVRNLTVQVDLFNKDGQFVDQCSEYLQGVIRPNESRNFKVSCGGCKDHPAVAHESYKVHIIGL